MDEVGQFPSVRELDIKALTEAYCVLDTGDRAHEAERAPTQVDGPTAADIGGKTENLAALRVD